MSFSKATSPTHGGYPSSGTSVPGQLSYTLGQVSYGSLHPHNITIELLDDEPVTAEDRPDGAELLRFGEMVDGRFSVAFCEKEGDDWVRAVFDPDASMTPLESCRITMLVQLASMVMIASTVLPLPEVEDFEATVVHTVKPITYIREHSLERHFRFSTL